MSQDIIAGRLDIGARLPAHRDLAWRLGIGLGTVTRAYGILERRGLVRSVKGRGTFVAVAEARKGPVIDLSRNAPPAVISERLLSRSLNAIARRVDADVFNAYPPVTGHVRFRNEMARWFRRHGMEADPECLLLTNGAQHALSVSLSTLCIPGGILFVEEQTYPGAISLARHFGVRLVAIAMDGEGMRPDMLERAFAGAERGRAAVYLTPTMQNPTTSSMGRARREALVRVCRKADVVIIEDDVYALAPQHDYPPIASLAPERVFYINSLSKTLNPALRLGGLVVPRAWLNRAEATMHASGLMVSPLSCSVMEQWLLDGSADVISAAIQEEGRFPAVARNGRARRGRGPADPCRLPSLASAGPVRCRSARRCGESARRSGNTAILHGGKALYRERACRHPALYRRAFRAQISNAHTCRGIKAILERMAAHGQAELRALR